MPKIPKKKTGGSAASDAVEGLVDPRAWPVLDARFSDAVGGGEKKKKPAAKATGKAKPGTKGGASCPAGRNGHIGGGCGCSSRKGGSVPASVPVGSNPYGPLDKHSAEARYDAALPNVKTFPPIRAQMYGTPSGGSAKKVTHVKKAAPAKKKK